ncbi:MAG: type II toxin-antitoxin system MqsA family antitoxin [Methyloprofundus sp.]|nr:type II toxin-antitoxin system MqsA family antitoxin [Methyloprofundus sp.]
MCLCHKCQSNNITLHSGLEEYTYKNAKHYIETEYSFCNTCNREFISKTQILENEKKIRDSKKQIDGLLSASEIKAIREKLHLSQTDAASIFGGGKNAFSKYERSEVTQSMAMDKLLRLTLKDRYIFRKLVDLSDIQHES